MSYWQWVPAIPPGGAQSVPRTICSHNPLTRENDGDQPVVSMGCGMRPHWFQTEIRYGEFVLQFRTREADELKQIS